MSKWERSHSRKDSRLSLETSDIVNRLNQRADEVTAMATWCHTEDDLTQQLLHRVDHNAIQPNPQSKEVRQARRLISTWLKIEQEASDIAQYGPDSGRIVRTTTRHTFYQSVPASNDPCSDDADSETSEVLCTPMERIRQMKAEMQQNRLASIEPPPQTQQKPPPIKRQSFASKFEKMKAQATKRSSDPRFTRKQKQQMQKENIAAEEKEEPAPVAQNVDPTPPGKDDKFDDATETTPASIDEPSEATASDPANAEEQDGQAEQPIEKSAIASEPTEPNKVEEKEPEETDSTSISPAVEEMKAEEEEPAPETPEIDIKAKKKEETLAVLRLQLEQIEKLEVFQNNKQQTQCFDAWYQLCLKNMDRYDKKLSQFDRWKLFRIFHKWYSMQIAKLERIRREAVQYQARMIELNKIAIRHYKQCQLRSLWRAWQQYIADTQTEQYLLQQRHQRQVKMKRLLKSVKTKAELKKIDKKQPLSNAPLQVQGVKQELDTTAPQIAPPPTPIPKVQPPKQQREKRHPKSRNRPSTPRQSNPKQKKKSKPRPATAQSTANRFTEKPSIKKITPTPPPKPSILVDMEKRAEERKKRREELRKQQEKQKQLEQQRIQLEKEEARRIEKEKERQEQERRERENEKRQRMLQLRKQKWLLAEIHSQRSNLIYRGWLPWMKCIENRKLQHIQAAQHHRNQQIKACFYEWRIDCMRQLLYKNNAKRCAQQCRIIVANQMSNRRLKSLYFQLWQSELSQTNIKYYTIQTQHRMNIYKRVFKIWIHRYTVAWEHQLWKERVAKEEQRMESERRLKRKIINVWKDRVVISKREKSKAETWSKVEQWLSEMRNGTFQP